MPSTPSEATFLIVSGSSIVKGFIATPFSMHPLTISGTAL
jgi:hypothetical protein